MTLAAEDNLNAMLSEVGRLDVDNYSSLKPQRDENSAEISVRMNQDGLTADDIVKMTDPAMQKLHGVEIDWQVNTSTLSQALGVEGSGITIEVSGRSLSDIREATEEIKAELTKNQELLERTYFIRRFNSSGEVGYEAVVCRGI